MAVLGLEPWQQIHGLWADVLTGLACRGLQLRAGAVRVFVARGKAGEQRVGVAARLFPNVRATVAPIAHGALAVPQGNRVGLSVSLGAGRASRQSCRSGTGLIHDALPCPLGEGCLDRATPDSGRQQSGSEGFTLSQDAGCHGCGDGLLPNATAASELPAVPTPVVIRSRWLRVRTWRRP